MQYFMVAQLHSTSSNKTSWNKWTNDVPVDIKCYGCCFLNNDSLREITAEIRLSEKLHKLAHALNRYDIPKSMLNVLHEAEQKVVELGEEFKTLRISKRSTNN